MSVENLKICLSAPIKTRGSSSLDFPTAIYNTNKTWGSRRSLTVGFYKIRNEANFRRTVYGPSYDSILDPLQREVEKLDVKSAIIKIVRDRIEPLTGIIYSFVDINTNPTIRISFESGIGSWSSIGTDALNAGSEEATMNLAWFDVTTVIHEFLHSIGISNHTDPNVKSQCEI